MLAALTPAANATSSWAFAKLQTVHARMIEAQMPQAQRDALVLGWLEGRDVRTIDNVDPLGWLIAQVALADRNDTAPTQFTAQWTGTIQAPADGDYRLSICPLELNFKLYARFRTQTTALWIGGQKVLDTAEERCTSAASGATLATWRAALGQLASAIQTQQQQQENLAREGYVTRLEQRRKKALERGDSQAASRYDQLLADAKASN